MICIIQSCWASREDCVFSVLNVGRSFATGARTFASAGGVHVEAVSEVPAGAAIRHETRAVRRRRAANGTRGGRDIHTAARGSRERGHPETEHHHSLDPRKESGRLGDMHELQVCKTKRIDRCGDALSL